MPVYNKLVRDLIPQVIENAGSILCIGKTERDYIIWDNLKEEVERTYSVQGK